MHCVWSDKATLLLDSSSHFDIEKARQNFKNGLRQVGSPSDTKGALSPFLDSIMKNVCTIMQTWSFAINTVHK